MDPSISLFGDSPIDTGTHVQGHKSGHCDTVIAKKWEQSNCPSTGK